MDLMNYITESCKIYWDFGDSEEKNFVKKFEKTSIMDGVLAIFVVNLIFTLISGLSYFLFMFADLGEEMIWGLIGILGSIFIMPLLIIFGFLIIHLFFMMFKAEGDLQDTLKFGLAMSVFPVILNGILGIFPIEAFGENFMLIAIFGGLIGILSLVVMIWTLVIETKIYSIVHKLSFGKTLLCLLLPIIAFILLALIVGVIIGILVATTAAF